MKYISNKKGYTLLEAVIVIGVILILTAGAMTGFSQYVAKNRVKTTIRNLEVLKKALNNMAVSCKGYPIREVTDATDLNSIRPIIDLTECQGNSSNPTDIAPEIYPTNALCPSSSLGNEILPAIPGSTAGQYHSSTLCHGTCDKDDKACIKTMGLNFYHGFISTNGDDSTNRDNCSPSYGGPSGPEFSGVYTPGWNYVLLHNNNGTAEVDKPVGVLCGMGLGYKTTVKIVLNTSGFFSGQEVAEGSGIFDITGDTLADNCPCGPWCEETETGRHGCCAPCTDGGGTFHEGIGYKF